MANAESTEGVVVWHERWCKKEIVSKVIGVVGRFLLLIVMAIPSKAFAKCPPRLASSLLAPVTNTNRASPAMDNNCLREGRDGRSATYRVLGMSPFAPFFHTRVISIHQGLSRNAPSGAPE